MVGLTIGNNISDPDIIVRITVDDRGFVKYKIYHEDDRFGINDAVRDKTVKLDFTILLLGSGFNYLDGGVYARLDSSDVRVRDKIISRIVYGEIHDKFRGAPINFKKSQISSLEISWLTVLTASSLYVFVKDYGDLRNGVISITRDIGAVGKKLYSIFSNEREMEQRVRMMNRREPHLRGYDDDMRGPQF